MIDNSSITILILPHFISVGVRVLEQFNREEETFPHERSDTNFSRRQGRSEGPETETCEKMIVIGGEMMVVSSGWECR